MQQVILLIALICSSFNSFSQVQETCTITVEVTGVKKDSGKVYVALYNSKESFLKTAYKGVIVNINGTKATAVFENIEKGEYAVSAFHDSNNNGKLDSNFLGIPKEPTGCSNGAKGFMGPPKYKNAKFTCTKDSIIPVKVK